jgi:hypothetical protein
MPVTRRVQPPSLADPSLPALPDSPDSPDAVAALIAARDVERARTRRQDNDIAPFVASNKALRREVQALRVRSWRDTERVQALEAELEQTRRDAERVQALEAELEQTRRARDSANRHSRLLADEVATLRSRSWYRSAWYPLAGWLGARLRSKRAEYSRRPVLAGDGPFFQRGFLLGAAAEIAGATVKRLKHAPSGMLIFGPYVNLPAGTYAVTLDARLYQRLPVSSNFKLDVVCDDAWQSVGLCWFRLHSFARWRSCELIFTVAEEQDYPDFEIRIWARTGTPLEIGRMDLYRLTEKSSPAGADASTAAPGANGGAASP